ncbi:histone acetyltransferases subunit 3-domain-containing protein [Glomus cerebriforme]|uniref:Histone acetyltransferases subunit 3-domain-containing protein n=1 Tax=Glomus cerebriforme TaxID=658196 RepID=A0A397TJW1_9GLOM|nr:histone acetyltransferases subunit 3-domain-containing protein [Glomus cerebriforme]
MINGKKFTNIRLIKKRDLKKLFHKNLSVSNYASSSSLASFGFSTNNRVDKSDLQNVKKEIKAIGNNALIRKEEFERCLENLDERSNTISNTSGYGGSVIHAGGVVARLGSPNVKRGASPAIHRVGSPYIHRIGSPNVHKNSIIKEKGSKKKGASIKVKVEDSDLDDLYVPTSQRKESSKTSSGTHRKKKMLKRSAPSEDDSDFSDFEKGIVKGSRTSTPNRTAQNKTLKSGNAGSFKKRKRSTSEVTNVATEDTPVVKSNVAIKTFYDYVEPYVRDFKDEDGDDVNPYEIPKLGRHYVEVWAEEERNLLPQTPDELESRRGDHMDIDGPPKSHDGDDEQRSANFIVDRLLAAFLEYPEATNFLNNESQVNGQNGQNGHDEKVIEQDRDKFQMDDRLKRELQALDLMDENDVQWDEREDDEISINLRELQAKLREQSKRNNYRKQILIEKVKAQIGWQQYQSYLETLDTQIEEAYLARFPEKDKSKITKTKKNKKPMPSISEVESLLDQRKKLVEGIGASFAPEEQYSFTPEYWKINETLGTITVNGCIDYCREGNYKYAGHGSDGTHLLR